MTREEFIKAAKTAVEKAVKKENIKSKRYYSISDDSSQYSGVIYFYKVTFNNPVTLENGKVIKGFHIMPYRITANDMENAKPKDKCGKFNEVVKSNPSFVDYDEGSGNFHKVPDGNFQIVLLDTNASPDGPGKIEDETTKNSDMYFPRPDEKYEDNSLEELIRREMKYLEEKEIKE